MLSERTRVADATTALRDTGDRVSDAWGVEPELDVTPHSFRTKGDRESPFFILQAVARDNY